MYPSADRSVRAGDREADRGGSLEDVRDAANADGALPNDLPPQTAVFAPDYAPAEIAEIAARLRSSAGLPDQPTGRVANEPEGLVDKVKDKLG